MAGTGADFSFVLIAKAAQDEPEEHGEPVDVEAPATADMWSFSSTKSVKEKGKTKPARSKTSELWDAFRSRSYNILGGSFKPRENTESCEDCTEVFLCHARLYVFAEKYDIGRLRQLALHKLHRTLAKFNLYEEWVGDIVGLIRYSYNNICDRSGSIEELRSFAIHYAACKVEHLTPSTQFQSLLESAGSFARDLLKEMCKRLD